MNSKSKWFRGSVLVLLVAILIVVGSPNRNVKCLTCFEQYEINSDAALHKYENCVIAAAGTANSVSGWVGDNTLCQAEWDSSAIENAARYVECMGLSVFGIKM